MKFATVLPKVALALSLLFTTMFVNADGASRSGTFTGLNNHVTLGTATVVQTDSGYVIELGEDFSFDGAPDPKVALGNDGKYDPATLIEPLRDNKGAQSYKVPGNEVYIWCEKFSVGLGVASIQ